MKNKIEREEQEIGDKRVEENKRLTVL